MGESEKETTSLMMTIRRTATMNNAIGEKEKDNNTTHEDDSHVDKCRRKSSLSNSLKEPYIMTLNSDTPTHTLALNEQ